MQILVSGSSGFLGRFLCETLKEQKHEVTKLNSQNCDLTKKQSLNQFNHVKYDQIFHLAVWMQAGDFCLKHPGDLWLINQEINTNILAWWQQYQPQAKMITMGTSCAYDPHYPLEEQNYLKGTPIPSLFSYGMTKRMLLTGLLSMNHQYGLDYLYIIPSTLFGPKYDKKGKQLHFIFDLIRKILRGLLYDEPVILWGDGHQKRELVHIQDFIKTMLKLNKTERNDLFNIGAGQEYSIQEFARTICNYTEFPFSKIQFDESKYVGARSKLLINDKLRTIMPEYNPSPVNLGIHATIDYFMKNRDLYLPQPSNLQTSAS